MTKSKKVTKNVKVVEYLERVARLEFMNEPTDDDIINIVSGLSANDYQTELTTFERHQRRYSSYYSYNEEKPEETTTTIYLLNIYKKVTKEVEG